MELKTMTHDRAAAREAYLEYREEFRKRQREEDAILMKLYRELARGVRILDVDEAMIAGGLDDKFRPYLALARADETWITCSVLSDGSAVFEPEWWHRARSETRVHRLPPGALTLPPGAAYRRLPVGVRAMVPSIPPKLRPPSDLSRWHILFEAEWSEIPPRDPALLKHLEGSLYAVVAVWDLTEIERKVLGMVRRP